MAYTLLDSAQDMPSKYDKGVIRAIYEDMSGGRNNILSILPIAKVPKLVNTFLVEDNEGSASGVGSRPVMGAYPEGTAAHSERGFTVGNIGGRVAIDEVFYLQEGYAEDPETFQLRAKSRLINRVVNNGIINGDRAVDPDFFDGLKKWVDSNQVVQVTDVGSYTNGLTVYTSATTQKDFLYAIDLLLDRVGGSEDPDVYLICNEPARRQIRKAVRELGWFGTNGAYYDTKVNSYGGVKFINPGAKTATTTQKVAENNTYSVLPNNLSYGGGSTACDIWAVRVGVEDGLSLRQLRPLHTRIIDKMENAPVKVIEIDWYAGIFPATDNCVAKLSGAIVV